MYHSYRIHLGMFFISYQPDLDPDPDIYLYTGLNTYKK